MAFHSNGLFRQSACVAALVATLVAGPALVRAAQPTGIGQLGDSLPHSRALNVLRGMQMDSVRVDSRHYDAAQRCDRAAMAAYQRQLDELAAQARNVLRNSGLETMQSIHNEQAHQIAENIAMRARHAASRQPQNCGGTETGRTGSAGTTGPDQTPDVIRGPTADRLREMQIESVRLNSLHRQAAERCDRAEMARIQAELDKLVDEAAKIMRETSSGPRGVKSVHYRNAERIGHNIAGRADEARKRLANCPDSGQPGTSGQQSACTPPKTELTPAQRLVILQHIGALQQALLIAAAKEMARRSATIDSFEAALKELRTLVEQGRMSEARDLVDELDEWLDDLERPPRINPMLIQPRAPLPKELIDKWDADIDDILDGFPPGIPLLKLDGVSSTILDMHNKARADYGVAPMRWNAQLACQAMAYGPTLAQYDRPVHSPRTGRETSRENLLQALRGTTVTTMVNVWTSEQRHFRAGVFPDVSSTGNWVDVGHYTQMVWPKTASVGCHVQRGIGKFDWLICRYAPPGNRDGYYLPPPLPPAPPPPPPPPPPAL